MARSSAVPIEGEIHVAVRWNGSDIERADVRSTRPFVAPRLLVGKTVDEACALVPLLFSICGRSQAIAAAAACEAAMGAPAPADVAAARAFLIAGEAMQEYLFRALIDWPRMRGEPPSAQALAGARRQLGDALAPLDAAARVNAVGCGDAKVVEAAGAMHEAAIGASGEVLGSSPDDWLKRCGETGVERWAEARETAAARLVADTLDAHPRFGASDVPLLPASGHDRLVRELCGAMDADDGFERAPCWHGEPAETGALARASHIPGVAAMVAKHGRSVATRLVARIAELAALAVRGASVNHGQVASGPGEGAGWVETARGLLVHRACVAQGRIAAYRIVAPTEWNFHADGALARGLRGARFRDEASAERGVRLMVQALDPCVSTRIEVAHA